MKYFIKLLITMSTLTVFGQTTDVFQIARTGTVEQMKTLFNQDNKTIDAVDSNGFTPLILATYRSNNEVALFLIEKTKHINYTSKMGSTLMAAIFKNNTLIFDALVKKGIDLNLKDENQTTALMLAVTLQHVEFAKKLIDNGADKTLKNHINKTAFQLAIDTNNQSLIQLFN